MNRRKFCHTMFLGSASLFALSSFRRALKDRKIEKLTILHTNDTHSHIDPFPSDHAKYPGQAGVMKRAGLIQQIKNTEEHVLLLDAGDIFQGTPYFNMYKGELEMKLMSQMQYDAATMGNHDFDAGIEGFEKVLPLANFPFICSNYNFENTILNGKIKPYHIFRKGNIKIGVIGVGVELDGLVSKNNYKETVYEDPIIKAQELADLLKEDLHCDWVICLSHLGYAYNHDKVSDTVLAQKTSNIDLIIGGHTHTFLSEPTVLKNRDNQPVLVNQVGWAGINLGRIDLYFEQKDNGDISFMTHNNSVLPVS